MKASILNRIILIIILLTVSSVTMAQEEKVDENLRYVKVDSSSPDAVMQDGTDFFESEPVCMLITNQPVTLTGKRDGEFVQIRAVCRGGKTEVGWIKEIALVKKPMPNVPTVSESGGIDSASFAQPGTIGYDPIDTTGMHKKEIPEPWNKIDPRINIPALFSFYPVNYNSPDISGFSKGSLVWPWSAVAEMRVETPSETVSGYVSYYPVERDLEIYKPISEPWSDFDLTSEYFKVFRSEKLAGGKKIILPITVIAAAGIATWLILDDDDENPGVELIVGDDNFTVNCNDSIVLNVLANDLGDGLTITNVSATGADATQIGNQINVTNIVGSTAIIQYTVTDNKENSASGTVTLTVIFPEILAIDDIFETTSNGTLNGNVINNDTGQNLEILSHTEPDQGSLTLESDGAFIYHAPVGFNGDDTFQYAITDVCGQSDTATVTIAVSLICDYSISAQITPADCGLENGIATVVVEPAGEYTIEWFDDSVGSEHSNLGAGIYTVVVSDDNGCAVSADIEMTELEANYELSTTTVDATCIGNGEITVSHSNAGIGPLAVQVQNPEGIINFEVTDTGTFSVSEFMNIIPGEYIITVYDQLAGSNCSNSITVTISDITPLLIAENDSITTTMDTPATGNMILNDQGLEISVISVGNEQNGTVDFSANGAFTFIPVPGFTGTASFEYTLQDACAQNATAMVLIDVMSDGCTFTADLITTNASCGFADGAISTTVSPPGNYTYEWSDGTTNADLTNVPTEYYTVTITDVDQNCSLDFTAFVDQDFPIYISDLVTSPANCDDAGAIGFNLTSPDGGGSNLIITHNGDEITQIVPDGPVNLSDYLFISEGLYTLMVSPVNAINGFSSDRSLSDCVEIMDVTITNPSAISVQISSITNPTSSTSSDGAILGMVSSGIPPPYDVYINGIPTPTPGFNFDFQNLTEGAYTIYAVNSQGCTSPSIPVDLISASNKSTPFSLTFELDRTSGSIESSAAAVRYNPAFRIAYNTGDKLIEPRLGIGLISAPLATGEISLDYEFSALFGKQWDLANAHFDLRAGPYFLLHQDETDVQIYSIQIRRGILFQPAFQLPVISEKSHFPINISLKIGTRYYTDFANGYFSWQTGLVFE